MSRETPAQRRNEDAAVRLAEALGVVLAYRGERRSGRQRMLVAHQVDMSGLATYCGEVTTPEWQALSPNWGRGAHGEMWRRRNICGECAVAEHGSVREFDRKIREFLAEERAA